MCSNPFQIPLLSKTTTKDYSINLKNNCSKEDMQCGNDEEKIPLIIYDSIAVYGFVWRLNKH
jgi:hypothetical protein